LRSSAAKRAGWFTAIPLVTASRAACANSATRSATGPPPVEPRARNVPARVWARSSRCVALGARSSESAAWRKCSPWLTSSRRPSVAGRALSPPGGVPRCTIVPTVSIGTMSGSLSMKCTSSPANFRNSALSGSGRPRSATSRAACAIDVAAIWNSSATASPTAAGVRR